MCRTRDLGFDLYVITDRKQAVLPLNDVIEQVAGEHGPRVAFQLREKDLDADTLLPLASELNGICRKLSSDLYINDRADIALASEAAGVQLSQRSLQTTAVQDIIDDGLRVGISVHGQEEGGSSNTKGADFLVLGPIFHTPSKAQFGPPIGLEMIGKVRGVSRLPVIAVGGINETNVWEVIRAGADGAAVISAVLARDYPAEAAQGLLQAMDEARDGVG